MKEILKTVYKYVPHIAENDEEVCEKSSPMLFGGDQLTVERARTVKNVLSNSDSARCRLEGLVPVVEDWHAKMCLYKVIIMNMRVYM